MTRYGLSDTVIAAIQGVFARYDAIESAILYGSRAKGNFREGSDIDLTLSGHKLSLQTLLAVANELDDLMTPYKFDLSIFETIENQNVIEHINRVGVLFYQRK